MKKVLAIVLGLVFVAAACNNNPPVANNNQSPAETPGSSDATGSDVVVDTKANPKIEISMTAAGFVPASITVKKGTPVTFVNRDTKSHWPASAPHPTHTLYPEFDPKAAINAGKSWTFTFNKVGEWKFHDHLNPTFFGTVTVTE